MRERTIPISLEDDDEARCAEVLLQTLTSHKGIGAVELDPVNSAIRVSYDPNLVSLSAVERVAERVGAQLGERYHRCSLRMDGVSCRSCGLAIERRLKGRDDIVWASANAPSGSLSLEYVGTREHLPQISKEIGESGVPVRPTEQPPHPRREMEEEEGWWEEHKLMVLAATTAIFLISGWGLGALGLISHNVQLAFYVVTYLAGGTFATH